MWSIIKQTTGQFNPIQRLNLILGGLLFSMMSSPVFAAEDPLSDFFTTSVQPIFASGSSFWKIVYAAEIVGAAYAWHKTKNPFAFLGIFFVAGFATFAVKHYVA